MVRYTQVFASYESGDRTGFGIMYDRQVRAYQLLGLPHQPKM